MIKKKKKELPRQGRMRSDLYMLWKGGTAVRRKDERKGEGGGKGEKEAEADGGKMEKEEVEKS